MNKLLCLVSVILGLVACLQLANGAATTCEVVEAYDCTNYSPCTQANRNLGKYYFTHINSTNFVQCDQVGTCFVRPCAPGTVWKQSFTTCVRGFTEDQILSS